MQIVHGGNKRNTVNKWRRDGSWWWERRHYMLRVKWSVEWITVMRMTGWLS